MVRRIRTYHCQVCNAAIIFARTVASERGPGGKLMPLDAEPNPEGRVAVSVRFGRYLYARVLTKGEDHDHRAETRYMTHHATCPGRGDAIAAEAQAFLADLEQKGDTTP